MKVVFLDFDGVLNSTRSAIAMETYMRLDPIAVRLVGKLCEKTGAKIVVSSSWRVGHTTESMKERMGEVGASPLAWRVIGLTDTDLGIRGEQIARWVQKNGPLESWVILDDDSDMLPGQPLVKTDHAIGFCAETFKQALTVLSGREAA